MAHFRDEVHEGEQQWVPWVGLALVVPAVLVLLVGVFGYLSAGSGSQSTSGGATFAVGIGGAAFTGILAFGALMLGLVGLVRGFRRSAPKNGRSVGLAGLMLECAIVVIAAAALITLALKIFI